MKIQTLGSIVLMAASSAQALELAPFSARYEVLHDGKPTGETTLSLERDGDFWRYRLRVEGTKGLARIAQAEADQWVRLAVKGDALHPVLARAEVNTLFTHRRIITVFDAANGQVRWEGDLDHDRRGPLPLSERATNATLLNLQLGIALAAAPPAKTRLEFDVCEKGRCEAVAWTVLANAPLDSALGRLETRRARREQPNKQRVTTVWYALQGPPAPLRLSQTEAGRPKYELRRLTSR